MSVNWSELPRTLFPNIMSWVDPKDVLQMAAVCKRWRNSILAHSTQQAYLALLEKRFAHLYPKDLPHQSLLNNLRRNVGWASTFEKANASRNLKRRKQLLERSNSEPFNMQMYKSEWYEEQIRNQNKSFEYWTSAAPYESGAEINPKMDVNATNWNNGTTPLHRFVLRGKVAKCLILLQNGADLEIKNLNGDTPLNLAIHNKRYDVVLLLLKNGAKGSLEGLSLLDVIETNQEELAELMIERGITLNEQEHRPPLNVACRYGSIRIVKALVQAGENMDSAIDALGFSPLSHAVFMGHLEIVQFLLDSGANPTLTDASGLTSQEQALSKWPGWTHLHKVLGCPESGCVYQFETPYVEAVAKGDLNYLTEFYFAERYVLNYLWLASTFGHLEVIRFFLKTGIDVNSTDDVGTSLIAATRNGRTDAVRLLLEEGADVSIPDICGKTALEYAQQYWSENTEMIQLLKGKKRKVQSQRNEPSITSLSFALEKRDYKTADLILENPGTLNEQDSKGQTALHIAVYKEDIDALRYLLKKGASYTLQDNAERTPLDLARLLGNQEIVNLFEIAQIRDGNTNSF